jgi:hypothetical protein
MHLVDAFGPHIDEFEIVNDGEGLLAGQNFHLLVLFSEPVQVLKTRRTLAFPSTASIVIGVRTTSHLALLNDQFSGRDHRKHDLSCQ